MPTEDLIVAFASEWELSERQLLQLVRTAREFEESMVTRKDAT